MRFALADSTPGKAGRPHWWAAGLSLCLALALVATLWVSLRDDEYVAPRPKGPSAQIQPAAAASLLQDLQTAVRTGDVAAAEALAADDDASAVRDLRNLVDNARRIHVRDFSLRYLDELGGVDEAGRWRAAADLTWRFAGFDRAPASAEVEVRFTTVGTNVSITGVGGEYGRDPVWLQGRVAVRRNPRTLVVSSSRVGLYARLATRAVSVVRRVVPRWDSGLVVEVPRSEGSLDDALDADPGSYANVAGVTSSVDGSGGPRAPVHVFLNPDRMRQLQQVGAQVVVSHEAAHVALHANASELPVWLSEGFADYVALRDVSLPLSTTAGQIIRQVRREGAPRALPDDQDFNEESAYFGAAYEASWLACRLLAERVGEGRLLAFYRRADGASDFAGVFRRSFDLTVPAFTRQWQERLTDLAE